MRCSPAAVVFGLACLAALASAKIHSLSVSSDNRFLYDIEVFGFQPGGQLSVLVSDYRVKSSLDDAKVPVVSGFLVLKVRCRCIPCLPPPAMAQFLLWRQVGGQQEVLEEVVHAMDGHTCLLDAKDKENVVIAERIVFNFTQK